MQKTRGHRSLISAEGERHYSIHLAPANLSAWKKKPETPDPPFSSIQLASLLNPACSTSFLLLVLVTIRLSPHPHQWGAAASHKTRRHLPTLPLPCIPCTSHFPLALLKRKSAATNQDSRPHYPDQDFHVHTNSSCMKSLSVDMLFGHRSTLMTSTKLNF